jgi:hypothetical protein
MAGRLQVFVNCPFDEKYEPLRDALVFTLLACKAAPRLSLDQTDNSESRAETILAMMKKCRLAVHDLSRVGIDESTGLPRFNMPFELGVFLGLKHSGTQTHRNKRCLILDAENYRYRDYLSDFAGRDIAAHGDDADELIRIVQSWISAQIGRRRQAPEPEDIADWLFQFKRKLSEMRRKGYRAERLPYLRKKWLMEDWIRRMQTMHTR